jgi:haloalkane dehalogenase
MSAAASKSIDDERNNKKQISSEFPFRSNFVEVHGSKIHYVDEGSGNPILFLHGNSTSSYVWRNIIPYLMPRGRCIAIDLIGMGKSDKPDIEYRFFDHAKYVDGFIEKMSLKDITLVVHDWGSSLGLYYSMRNESNVTGIAFMEAILMPISSWELFPHEVRKIFQNFRTPDLGWDMIVNQNFFIEQVLRNYGAVRKFSEEELKNYREPFQRPEYRKPLWRWPNEIPIEGTPKDIVRIVEDYNTWLQKSTIPKLLIYGEPGALMPKHVIDWCMKNLSNLKTVNIGAGIHYLQEDNPHAIGLEIAKWYDENGLGS